MPPSDVETERESYSFKRFDKKYVRLQQHILLSLEIVIERISLSFVGSIATHQSHINSEPTFS
jgi:hypothetical protein